MFGGAVNQVFHGASCVLGSSQSAVGPSNFWRGDHGNLSGGVGPSNHISLEGFHRFSSSVETKAELLFQSNIFLDPNSEVKIPL